MVQAIAVTGPGTSATFKCMLFRLGNLVSRYFLPAACLATILASCATAPQLAPVEAQFDRIVAVSSVSNFRDLGGYATHDGRTTKWRKVFRSGEFSRLTRGDQDQLSRLNIEWIIDLRSDEERARAPSRWIEGNDLPQTILLPIGGNAADWSSAMSRQLQSGEFSAGELRATFIDMYASVPLDNAAQYQALFSRILASEGQPVLFHCTAGKDRTGIGAALLLSALDVPRATIMDDFMATNAAVDVERMSIVLAQVFSQRSRNKIDPASIRPMLTVEPVFLETTFTAIESEYGSVDNYLRDAIGLTDAKRAQLRKLLLN